MSTPTLQKRKIEWLWVACVLSLTACELGADRGAPAQIPASWREVRDSPGHQRHLGAAVRCTDCHKNESYDVVALAACARCHDRPTEGIHTRAALTITSTVDVSHGGCLSCHPFRSGTAPAATLTCLSCHDQAQGEAPPITDHPASSCTACHHPHTAKVLEPARCLSCHSDHPVAHGQDPNACARCHAPHQSKLAARDGCADCHAREAPVVTAARSIPKHNGCLGCHAPHDVATRGRVACETCHEDIAARVGHPTSDRVGHSCLGCHPPHGASDAPPDRRVTPRPCATCHVAAAPEGFAHAPRAACTGCHPQHAVAITADRLDCSRCHDVGAVGGHTACVSCHVDAPHAPKIERAPCADCHAAIAARAPAGHQKCTGCHQVHGKLRPSVSCASCHADKAAAQHGNIEGGCRSCHGPHDGQPPPSCNNCHATGTLGGLHALQEHQACAKCHAAHQPPPRDRDTCIACHKSKTAHYPEAKRCAACHAFLDGTAP